MIINNETLEQEEVLMGTYECEPGS